MTRKKTPPPTFTQRHAEKISKLKLVLIVVCLIAIPVSFLWNQADVGSVNNRVTRIESPCQRYGSESKLCQEAFETAVHSITHRIACYIDHESGKPFKPSCIGVRLRIEVPARVDHRDTKGPTATEGGDANSAPTGHSQPGRHEGGSRSTGVDGNGGGVKESPGNSTPPKVPTEHGGGGEGVPSSPPSSAPSSPGASSSSTTVERTKETVVEAAPPEAIPPVTSGLGEVLGGVGHVVTEPGATVEELGHGVDETVHGATCQLGIGQC